MILVIDDNPAIRASLTMLFRHSGHSCKCASSPSEALDEVRQSTPDLVILDMNFGHQTTGEEGIILLRQIKIFAPDTPVILITAWGSIELAVEGMRNGAFDFVTKPWDNRSLIRRVETALDINRHDIEDGSDNDFNCCGIIGETKEITDILSTVRRIAPTNATVLITGENGTGKELIAEAIHRNSRRADRPFVKVNLGGISGSLFESEMFGHCKGAFTGAFANRVGRFEAADGGTIFLDEIGELDLSCQVKLLRVLQDQKFEPLGSSITKKVDVRVICATNADLRSMVADRTFREDLFYRINLVEISLPPLRRRPDDIPGLAKAFLDKVCRGNALGVRTFSPEALSRLKSLPFPGNIRELKNLIERIALLSDPGVITADIVDELSEGSTLASGGNDLASAPLEDIEKNRIIEAAERCGGNISRMALELGISRGALYRRLEKYGIKP